MPFLYTLTTTTPIFFEAKTFILNTLKEFQAIFQFLAKWTKNQKKLSARFSLQKLNLSKENSTLPDCVLWTIKNRRLLHFVVHFQKAEKELVKFEISFWGGFLKKRLLGERRLKIELKLSPHPCNLTPSHTIPKLLTLSKKFNFRENFQNNLKVQFWMQN